MDDAINICFQNHSMYIRVAKNYLGRLEDAEEVTYDTDLIDRYDYAEEEEKPYMEGIPNQLVIDAIESLSPSYLKVAKMYLLDGYKHHEIAEVLNISLGTSKSNLSKSKKNVIRYIKKHHDDRQD